jgi:hypothetical protein
VLILAVGCTAPGAASGEVEAVKQKYGGYTLEQARKEGY